MDVWIRQKREYALPRHITDPSTPAALIPDTFAVLVPEGPDEAADSVSTQSHLRRLADMAHERLPSTLMRHAQEPGVEACEDLPSEVSGSARFWLYLASPVWIKHDQQKPEIRLPGDSNVTVRGAYVGPPEVHGGHSMVTGNARGNRPLVPAGSAWLIELSGGSAEDRARVLRSLHGTHPLGPEDEARFGFGRTFVGLGPDRFRVTTLNG